MKEKDLLQVGVLALVLVGCSSAEARLPQKTNTSNITEYVFTECRTKDGNPGYDVTVVSPDGKTQGTVCKTFSPTASPK